MGLSVTWSSECFRHSFVLSSSNINVLDNLFPPSLKSQLRPTTNSKSPTRLSQLPTFPPPPTPLLLNSVRQLRPTETTTFSVSQPTRMSSQLLGLHLQRSLSTVLSTSQSLNIPTPSLPFPRRISKIGLRNSPSLLLMKLVARTTQFMLVVPSLWHISSSTLLLKTRTHTSPPSSLLLPNTSRR